MKISDKTISNVEHIILLFMIYIILFLKTTIDWIDALLLSGFFLLSGTSWYASTMNSRVYEDHRLAFRMVDVLAIILGIAFILLNLGGIS